MAISTISQASSQKQKSDSKKEEAGPFKLPDLPYALDALEPFIDAETMRVHHDAHHKAYVDHLNEAIQGTPAQTKSLEEILAQVSKYPEAVKNNAGGHWNHSFFWKILSGDKENQSIDSSFEALIKKNFGSLADFKKEFDESAKKLFGSGWTWLIKKADGSLAIASTHNQDNPLMDTAEVKGSPLLACDLWEHAYYLKHENKREEYLGDFWKVVNWKEVKANCERAKTLM